MRVYGSKHSYYTGKLESYPRYRSIGYERLPTYGHAREVLAGAVTTQMPAARLDDGRWLSDSTPMIAWLEGRQNAPSIYPADPACRFVALLLEDYADEWLWRPAMHHRWIYASDRRAPFDRAINVFGTGVPACTRGPITIGRRAAGPRGHRAAPGPSGRRRSPRS